MQRAYGAGTGPNTDAATALLDKIKAGKVTDGFKPADVYLKGWAHLGTPEAVKMAAALLCDLGHLRRIDTKSGAAGGRPSTTYQINPKTTGKGASDGLPRTSQEIHKHGGRHPKKPKQPRDGGFLGSLGAPPGPFQKIEGATAANDPGRKQTVAHAAEALPDHPAPAKAHSKRAESAQKPAVPSCKTCRHLRRPGLSDGHCGGRDDLPHAYTAGHPLRRLPDDGGASCTTWELVDSKVSARVAAGDSMKPPTLERRRCLGCRLLQPINGALECLDLIRWHQGTAGPAVQAAHAAHRRQAHGRGLATHRARARGITHRKPSPS
jgi:hypothetical protein